MSYTYTKSQRSPFGLHCALSHAAVTRVKSVHAIAFHRIARRLAGGSTAAAPEANSKELVHYRRDLTFNSPTRAQCNGVVSSTRSTRSLIVLNSPHFVFCSLKFLFADLPQMHLVQSGERFVQSCAVHICDEYHVLLMTLAFLAFVTREWPSSWVQSSGTTKSFCLFGSLDNLCSGCLEELLLARPLPFGRTRVAVGPNFQAFAPTFANSNLPMWPHSVLFLHRLSCNLLHMSLLLIPLLLYFR